MAQGGPWLAMYRTGHYGVALLGYAPFVFLLVAAGLPDIALLGGAGVLVGSMLPDLDQRLPFVEHRGPTHTVGFAVVIALGYGLIGGVLGWQAHPFAAIGLAVFGVVIGGLAVGSHLLADAITPAGIEPYGNRIVSFDLVRAANPIVNIGLAVVGVGAVLLAFVAGQTIGFGW